jgi:CDP-glucose 4,6-dehydratase
MESVEMIKGKKILVTGGAGFIGGHLVNELIILKAEVYVVDIIINPKSIFSLKNLKEKVKLSIIDIRNREKIISYINKNKFDYIIHLAAEPIVEDCYKNPIKAFETNIMGTVNILDAARKSLSVKGIIIASSDKAYGKTKKAYTENFPLRGDHPYDVSKSCQDLISQAYFKTFGLPIVITRFGNVYGEGDLHMNRIIPGICEAIAKNRVLKIRSDGKYVRDYLYVKDVVLGYLTLLKNINKIKGEAFNFGSKDSLSVLELIKATEKTLNKKITYKILNIAKNEIPYQHLDFQKIRSLGWKNNYTLNSVFPSVLNWYKKYI